MKKIIILLSSICLILGSGVSIAQAADYQIIVNSENPVSSLSRVKISKMFLKKVTEWGKGEDVLPVDLVSSSKVRESFSQDIHGKSVATIKNYWQQQIFSGRNTPPPQKTSDAEVLSYVKANPGAIGYVSLSANVDEVKVIQIQD